MSRTAKYWVGLFFLVLGPIIGALLFYTASIMIWSLGVFGGTSLPLAEAQETAENVSWFDDYYTIEYIDAKTIAIGEPRYHQRNYSYLILGSEKAVLFDSGPGVRDIAPVVKALTSLPVTVTTSHLHYDHIGNLASFDRIALIDLPVHKAQVNTQGGFAPSADMHLGAMENITPPAVTVNEWWQPSAVLDLGERKLTVLHTPGHTDGSLMLHDPERKYLFTGDYIYPWDLISFAPDSHMGEYLKTSERLLKEIDSDTVLLTAHASAAVPWQAPRLDYRDLDDLRTALQNIKDNKLASDSFFPGSYVVNDAIVLLADFSWNMEWDAP